MNVQEGSYLAVSGMDEAGNVGVFGYHTETTAAFEQAQYVNKNGGCAKIFLTKTKDLTPGILKEIEQMVQKFLSLKLEEQSEEIDSDD